MMYSSWNMVRNGWTDRRMDGRMDRRMDEWMEEVTYRGGCPNSKKWDKNECLHVQGRIQRFFGDTVFWNCNFSLLTQWLPGGKKITSF